MSASKNLGPMQLELLNMLRHFCGQQQYPTTSGLWRQNPLFWAPHLHGWLLFHIFNTLTAGEKRCHEWMIKDSILTLFLRPYTVNRLTRMHVTTECEGTSVYAITCMHWYTHTHTHTHTHTDTCVCEIISVCQHYLKAGSSNCQSSYPEVSGDECCR